MVNTEVFRKRKLGQAKRLLGQKEMILQCIIRTLGPKRLPVRKHH